MAIIQAQLDADLSNIQILHARQGEALANALAYHTENMHYIETLSNNVWLVYKYKQILLEYVIMGDEDVNDEYNFLSETNIQNIIDDAYRILEEYNT